MSKSLMALVCAPLVIFPVVLSATKHPKPVVPAPVVRSLTADPSHLSDTGGRVVVTARVRHATSCTFGGAVHKKVACSSGTGVARVDIGANRATDPRLVKVTLSVKGKGGKSPLRSVTIREAAHPPRITPRTTTTTTTTPTTTTTKPTPITKVTTTTTSSPPSTTTSTTTSTSTTGTTTTGSTPPTSCTGPCQFTFPSPDVSGYSSVALNGVTLNVPCPDQSQFCDATDDEQIDDVNVTMCAGADGVTLGGLAAATFVLTLSDTSEAQLDSVTYDSNVATAFGSYGAFDPGQCATGDIYFDVPTGLSWDSLAYTYFSSSSDAQATYVWQQ